MNYSIDEALEAHFHIRIKYCVHVSWLLENLFIVLVVFFVNVIQTTVVALFSCVSLWFDQICRCWDVFKRNVLKWSDWIFFFFTSISPEVIVLSWDRACPGLGYPYIHHLCQRVQGYLVQGGSFPVWFASLQYLSFRMNAADLGCLCLVKTPFLLPTTRVIPADTRWSMRTLPCAE